MRFLVLGSDGMVGHVVKLFLQEKGHQVTGSGEDLTIVGIAALKSMIQSQPYDAVINCSAIINQYAEADKDKAVLINSFLPHYLESITAGTDTVVVHRSTDCIFSGARGAYTLEDWPDANSFYARSKTLGELDNGKDITIRTSLIGPETDEKGTGLFNWFYNQSDEANGFANAIWTGITTIEFARAIEWLLKERKHGIFQLVPEYAISKYELLRLFEKYYPHGRRINRIENQRVDKSLVPVCGGYAVPDYESQIGDMRKWTDDHRGIYRYE